MRSAERIALPQIMLGYLQKKRDKTNVSLVKSTSPNISHQTIELPGGNIEGTL